MLVYLDDAWPVPPVPWTAQDQSREAKAEEWAAALGRKVGANQYALVEAWTVESLRS